MSEILSQQEIDALLRIGEEPKAEEPKVEEPSLKPDEIDVLGEIGNISMGTAATTMSVLLRKKVNITTPVVSFIQVSELEKEFPIPCVAVEVDYTEGLEGSSLLIMKNDDVKIITDLLMGGSGTYKEGELSELHLSAISEVMNQMIGSSSTSMATFLKQPINIAPPKSSIIDFNTKEPIPFFKEDGVYIRIAFRMEVEGLLDSHIMQIMTLPFGKMMVEKVYDLFQNEADAGQTGPAAANQAAQQNPSQYAREKVEVPPQQKVEVPLQQKAEAPPQPIPAAPDLEPEGRRQQRVDVKPVQFQSFGHGETSKKSNDNIDLILDIPLQITVELGRTHKEIRDILKLGAGSVIELDKLAGDPVDIFVNGKYIACGEVVVIDENFAVRVNDIVSPAKRISNIHE